MTGRPAVKKKDEIHFTRSRPEACPAFRDYYIQDRLSGKSVYGHDTYEYALFRKIRYRLDRTFRTRRQACSYVSAKTGLSRWDIRWQSCSIICNDRELLGVEHCGILWRIEKRTYPVRVSTRPIEDERITGWHMTYSECLTAAKEIIKQEESKCSGGEKGVKSGKAEW